MSAVTDVPDRVPVETLRGDVVFGDVVGVISKSAPAPRVFRVRVDGCIYRVSSKDVGFI